MDLLTVVSTCSLHHDLTLVLAMAMSFSHGNPYMVQDAAADSEMAAFVSDSVESADPSMLPMPQAPQSRQAALDASDSVRKRGGVPVVGVLPVPFAWAAMFQRKPAELLNACTSVSIATAMLSEFEYHCGAKGGRKCVLTAYAQAIGLQYFAADVLHELDQHELGEAEAVVDETEEVLQAAVLSDVSGHGDEQWGARSLFFAPAATEAPASPKSGRDDTKSPARGGPGARGGSR